MIPTFKLYDSTGISLIYTFLAVQDCNFPHTEKKYEEITSQRGKGALIIDGGESSFEMFIEAIITGADSEELEENIYTLESTIVLNTAYVLKIKTSATRTFTYNVKRLSAIDYPVRQSDFKNTYQVYRAGFLANSW